MKLETAQALKWPWPVKHSINNPICYSWDTGRPVGVNFPSVPEMLDRMPVGTILRKGTGFYSAAYYKGRWNKEKKEWDKSLYKIVRHADADEALAELCRWLWANGLMSFEVTP